MIKYQEKHLQNVGVTVVVEHMYLVPRTVPPFCLLSLQELITFIILSFSGTFFSSYLRVGSPTA